MPALYLVQEQQGYITGNAMRHVAEVISRSAPEADVEDVRRVLRRCFSASPVGNIRCRCAARCRARCSAPSRVDRSVDQANSSVKPGETDPSGTFTVMEFECLGACDRAPVVMVNNDHWHECQSPDDVKSLLEALRTKDRGADRLSLRRKSAQATATRKPS